jgi:hypothetical protein
MSKISVQIQDKKRYYFMVVSDKEGYYKLSLQKNEPEIMKFILNQSMSMDFMQRQYKNKSLLTTIQRRELTKQLIFLYTMDRVMKYVALKNGHNVFSHNFNQYKELQGIEVEVHEK